MKIAFTEIKFLNTKLFKPTVVFTGLLLNGSIMAQEMPEAKVALFSPGSSFRTWSFGLNSGVTTTIILIGKNDLTNLETELGCAGFVKDQIPPSIGIRADYFRGKLKADNNNNLGNGSAPNRPNVGFETDINCADTLGGEFRLANVHWIVRKAVLQPYVTAAAGLMGYSPKIALTSIATHVDFKTDGGNIHQVVMPVGLDMKVGLSDMIDLGYNMSFVD